VRPVCSQGSLSRSAQTDATSYAAVRRAAHRSGSNVATSAAGQPGKRRITSAKYTKASTP
jgi:hypothetical protein